MIRTIVLAALACAACDDYRHDPACYAAQAIDDQTIDAETAGDLVALCSSSGAMVISSDQRPARVICARSCHQPR